MGLTKKQRDAANNDGNFANWFKWMVHFSAQGHAASGIQLRSVWNQMLALGKWNSSSSLRPMTGRMRRNATSLASRVSTTLWSGFATE